MNSPGSCARAGCGRLARALGYCDSCYRRLQRHGSPEPRVRFTRGTVCEADGCPREPDAALGLCWKHYYRWRKHGTVELPPGLRVCARKACDSQVARLDGKLCRTHERAAG